MPSKFFYGAILLGVVLGFIAKDFKIGLLPFFIYVFIRLIVNLMLIVTGKGDRP